MEAERLVPELPGTTPFGVSASEARSTSCASASRSAASIEGLLSPSGASEDGAAAGPLYSADVRTEQAFFGNFLPVSSGLRYAFMRRCPSAPSELSAADQQRLLQQQRLHVHLLHLERKVSMQERLLYLVQKYGEAPTLLQQQGAGAQLPASPCKAEDALSWQVLQDLFKKGDEGDKSGSPVPPSISLFNDKRCLSLAELPSLLLPPQQRDLSIPGGSGGLKGMNFGAVEGRGETNAGRHKLSTLMLKTDAVDDGTPSTAAVSEHSPASDKRAVAPRNEDSRKTAVGVDLSLARGGARGECGVPASTKSESLSPGRIGGEQAAVGSTFLPLDRPPPEKTREEKDERTASSPLWHSLAPVDPQANKLEEVEDEVSEARTLELQPAQQPTELGIDVARAEVCQQSMEKEGMDLADTFSIRRAADVDKERTSREVAPGSVPPRQKKKADREEREGMANTAGGRKSEGMRPPDQFFRIKLCAKYMRRTCRKGSRCSYAHAEEELREIPNLWKTKLCASHKQGKPCPLDTECPFAHGEEELRCTAEYYKTKLCKFWVREVRCEAGEGCRHAHGAAELRQRMHHYGDFARGGVRVLRQESQQVLDGNSGTHTGPKDTPALGTPVHPLSSPTAAPAIGKRSGALVPLAAKAQEQNAPAVWCGRKNDRPRTRGGHGEDRHSQGKHSPSRQNDGEVNGSHRRSDASQGQGATVQRGSPSTSQKRGKGDGGRRSSGKGATGEVGSARGPVKRRGGKGGGGFRAGENAHGGTTRIERRRASASATLSETVRSGNGSSRKTSGGKEAGKLLGHGPFQQHGGNSRGGEAKDSPPLLNKRRNTVGSHGAQQGPPSYYGNLNKNGQAHYGAGTSPAHDQAERTTLHAQRPHLQHQQTQAHPHQKFPVHMPESSALNVANANTSALYGLTAGINPYGALAACQQQAPYGLSILPAGPPSCGNLQTAAAAAAAVAAMAQQQQQQLEAAAKAVGTPMYQGVHFLAASPFAAFTPSHLSYAAPAHAMPSPFAASHVGGGGSAGARSCGGAYAASYPVYPYSSPSPSPLVAEANAGAVAPCVSPSYSPRGISVSCSVCSCDAGSPEVCALPSQREGLEADGIHADVREAEPAPGRYISQGRSPNTATAGHPVHTVGAFVVRATPQYPCEWMQEGGSRCSYREDCATYSESSASA